MVDELLGDGDVLVVGGHDVGLLGMGQRCQQQGPGVDEWFHGLLLGSKQ